MRHVNQVARADDGVLDSDQANLALVRDLRVMLADVIQALEHDVAVPGTIEVLAAADTRICLSDR